MASEALEITSGLSFSTFDEIIETEEIDVEAIQEINNLKGE